MNIINTLLRESVLVGALLGIFALIIVDVVTGVAVSLARGLFEWGRVLDFLRTNVVPYLLSWGAIEGLMYAARHLAFSTEVVTPFAGLAATLYALIVARLVGSVLGNLSELGVDAGES